MKSEIFEALELLEKEKGIKPEYMLEKIEAALLSALKRDYGASDNVRVDIDLEINPSAPSFAKKWYRKSPTKKRNFFGRRRGKSARR
jgi:N utilization substance protein A